MANPTSPAGACKPSPQAILMRMGTDYWVSQMISVAARLGIADLVKDGAKTSADLARLTGTHPRSLHRLLRGLASVGIFAEDSQTRFVLTPLADYLRSDVPGSMRSAAIMTGEQHFRAWGDLMHCIRTGRTGFEQVYGKPIFDWLSEHPEEARTFDEAMVGVHGAETGAMLDAYDFSSFGTLIDIGGGNASVLTAVLQRYPELRGILFDLPHVVERAKGNLRAAGLEQRCTTVGGSFFESVPGGADAYLMRHIIHDWDDDQSLTILRNCRKAMTPKARFLLVESVIPPGNDPSFAKLLDLNMLVVPGGLERTETEYRELFQAAGFRLARIVPTRMEISIIEGEPV